MANPYHDEEGKFCSKGEMQTAIQRLADAGKIEEAYSLSKEFQRITEHNQTEKLVSQIPVEEVEEYKKILSRVIPSNGSLFVNEAKVSEDFDKVLANLPAEKIDSIEQVAIHELDQATVEYEQTQADKAEFYKNLASETGYNSVTDLRRSTQKLLNSIEEEGNKHLDAIREQAIQDGVPRSYAYQYFRKLATRLGLSASFVTGPYNQEIVRPDTPVIWPANMKNLKARVKDKEVGEILHRAIDKYASANADSINKMNDAIKYYETGFNKINPYVNKESELLRASSNSIHKQNKAEARLKGVREHLKLREALKETGYSGPNLRVTKLSDIRGEEISTDQNGKVMNVWVIERDTDGNRSSKRIVDVFTGPNTYGAKDAGNHLVDENGRKYQNFIHYANFGKTETDFQIVIDPNIITDGKEGKYAGKVFQAMIDSGG